MAAALFYFGGAHAGIFCKDFVHDPKVLQTADKKNLELKKALNATKARVAIIARVGSDVSKYGLYYTHAAFAIKKDDNSDWKIIQEINPCGTDTSNLHKETLVNFFIDDLLNSDFEVIVPTKELQEKLVQTLQSPIIDKLHEPHYSMIAYPFSTQYQNSNQWILESIAASLTGQDSRSFIQSYLQKTGYQPTVIHLSRLDRLGARFRTNVKFDDHPASEEDNYAYSVVTVDSIVSWLKRNHLFQSLQESREKFSK